jgi:hypothetical protein
VDIHACTDRDRHGHTFSNCTPRGVLYLYADDTATSPYLDLDSDSLAASTNLDAGGDRDTRTATNWLVCDECRVLAGCARWRLAA